MSLLSVPVETILLIAEFLTLEADLSALSRVNARLYHGLVESLYRRNAAEHGGSALIWAAEKGYETTAQRSLDGGTSTEVTNKQFQTPLCLAAMKGHVRLAELLLGSNGVNVNAQDEDGQTPLLAAAREGHGHIVRLLLEHEGIQVNAADEDGRTPLITAAVYNRREIVNLLLEHEQVDLDACDCEGATATWWASQYGWKPERNKGTRS